MSRNSSPLYASLDWFKEHQAINEDDFVKFEQIKNCRNELSHKLFSLIGTRGLPDNFEVRFLELVELLHKIHLWWVMNVEIPTNPDYDGKEVDENNVKVGSVMAIQMLVDIALGDEKTANSYFEEFIKSQVNTNG